MATTIEAPSPATSNSGDANNDSRNRSANLSMGEAAILLMAQAGKKQTQQPVREAPEENASEANAQNAETADKTTHLNPAAEEATAATSDLTQQAPEETAAAEASATETPEGEAAAAPDAAATEEDAEPVHSQTISFTPEQQALFNKRLGKEVAKTKAIKAQMTEQATKLADLESKLQQQQGQPAAQAAPAAAPVVVNANLPLGDINDIESLGKRQQAAKEIVRYAEAVLDDPALWQTITDPNNESREIKVHKVGEALYTEANLRKAMRDNRVTLEDHIPARAQFLAAKQQATQQAHVDFPFMTDKQSAGYQLAESGRRNPHLAQIMALPNSEWLIGAIVEGKLALDARQAAAKKPAAAAVAAKPKLPAAKPTPDQVATSASGAASRAPIGSAARQALAQELAKLSKKGGIGQEDAATLLLRSEQLRKSPR